MDLSYLKESTYEQDVSQQQNTSQLDEWMSQLQLPTSVLYELIIVSALIVSIVSLYERVEEGVIRNVKMMNMLKNIREVWLFLAIYLCIGWVWI